MLHAGFENCAFSSCSYCQFHWGVLRCVLITCHRAEAERSIGFCLMKKNTYFWQKNPILNDSCKAEGFGMQKKSQKKNLGKTKENNPIFLKFSKSWCCYKAVYSTRIAIDFYNQLHLTSRLSLYQGWALQSWQYAQILSCSWVGFS